MLRPLGLLLGFLSRLVLAFYLAYNFGRVSGNNMVRRNILEKHISISFADKKRPTCLCYNTPSSNSASISNCDTR